MEPWTLIFEGIVFATDLPRAAMRQWCPTLIPKSEQRGNIKANTMEKAINLKASSPCHG